MISACFDLAQFVEAVRNRDYFEIIDLADQEALEAWRGARHISDGDDSERQKRLRYTGVLEDLIDFVRYGVEPMGLTESESDLFQYLCRGMAQKTRAPMRC